MKTVQKVILLIMAIYCAFIVVVKPLVFVLVMLQWI